MPKIKNIIKGKKNQAYGRNFEILLARVIANQGFEVIKIPEGCRQGSFGKLIRVKSPFDFVFIGKDFDIFCDTKLCSEPTFSHSRITVHQVIELKRLERKGKIAGYIVRFDKLEKTVFFSATLLSNTVRRTSLKPEDGILLGHEWKINFSVLSQLLNQEKHHQEKTSIPETNQSLAPNTSGNS